MKKTIQNILLFVSTMLMAANSQADVSLYFAAHEDDWQLFMGVNAYGDMQSIQSDPNAQVIIFHITAGDAGGTMSYVRAREECAMNSIRFAASAGSVAAGSVITGNCYAQGHNIMYKRYGMVTAFFLRLPDGCFVPQGCTGAGSLEGLHSGAYATLTAVDSSATYTGWSDLVNTIQSIVGVYHSYNNMVYPGTKIWVNHPDIDQTVNPNDHPDHHYTGVLAEDATSIYCPNFVSFIDYYTSSLAPNLSNDDIENESALFGACTLGLVDGGASSTWEYGHKSWLDKNYYSVWNLICKHAHKMPPVDKGLLSAFISDPVIKEKILVAENSDMAPNNAAISIYPNPATNMLTIKNDAAADASEPLYKIEVLDLMARKSLKDVYNQNSINIDELATGVYFLKIYTSANTFITRKFSKQ